MEIEQSYFTNGNISTEWRILDEEEYKNLFNSKLHNIKKHSEIFMLVDIWELQFIKSFEVSSLLHPVYFKLKNEIEEHNIFKYYKHQELFYDENLPANIYISYPFSSKIELKIFPVSDNISFENKEKRGILPLGYLAWQVSKLFARIYEISNKDIEIYSHSIEDLQLSSFKIYKDNNFILGINS